MEHKISIKSNSYVKAMVMLHNFKLKLSPMETDILSCMLNHNMKTIDSYSRETIRLELNKDKFSTNNYIVRLRDKGILITKPADKALYVNPSMYDLIKDKKVSFEFELLD